MKKILFGLAAICLLSGLTFLFSCPPKPPEPEKPITLLIPEDGAVGVSVTAEMTWKLSTNPGSRFYEFDVFLDTDRPPSKKVATRLSLPSWYPNLLANTTYYWYVVGEDYNDGKTIDSEIWQFTTAK